MRVWWWVCVTVLGVLAALPAAAQPALLFDREAEQVARAYLKAKAETDTDVLARLRPTEPANKFGPSLFLAMPRLEKPRADAHRGVVEFTGKCVESLPGKGLIELTKVDEEPAAYQWKVQQIFWTDRAPGLPKRSVTKQDKAQEKQLLAAAQRYLAAWLKGDYAAMSRLHFDKLSKRNKGKSYFSLRSASFTPQPTSWGELRVSFQAKVVIAKVLPKTVNGDFYMLKEDGQWKVRGNAFTL